MRATLITCRDPFRPHQSRKITPLRRRRRLRALAPQTRQPHICLLNGRPVLRAEWGRKVRDGDVVAFVLLPQGGGGSNPMRLLLTVVVIIASVYFGPQVGAAMGFSGTAATAAGQAVIMTAGNILVNALVPPPRMDTGGWGNAQAASPTYSLSSSGNQARLGGPIPVIYGRHLVYPDFAAQPYIEFGGNEQYLYQLHVIGQGRHDIEAIRIEDTPVASFEEIEYQAVQPGESVTLFPTQVTTSIEVSGQELLQNQTLGPFVANASGTTANVIGIDIVVPRGMYYANDNGSLSERSVTWTVEARAINDDGNPIGIWSTLGSETLSAATTTPQRVSYRYSVTPGRYEVRATRTNVKLTGTRESNELAWGSLRAYLVGSNSYGDLTLLALRMRASNNLSSLASRKINCIVTRKLPIWTGSAWTEPQATVNPAWALADIARASYGAGLADGRIDLDGLKALADQWAARGDECNLVFDSQSTIWQALQTVARTGRAFPFLQGGILRVYRDGPQVLPAGMFTPRNMTRNSFKLSYKMPSEEQADAVDVEYFDRLSWSWKTVRAALPDSSSLQPVKLKLPGVTSRAQAWREGIYMAACNRFRRRFLSFSTEMDGFIPALGDTVVVTHDMPSWGQSSEVVAFDPATHALTLTDALTFGTGSHYLTWRSRDGRPVGPFLATPGSASNVIVLLNWTSDSGYPLTSSNAGEVIWKSTFTDGLAGHWSSSYLTIEAGTYPPYGALVSKFRDCYESGNDIPVEPGQVFVCSADVDSSQSQYGGNVGLGFRNASGDWIGWSGAGYGAAASWTHISQRIKVPDGAVVATPWVQIEEGGKFIQVPPVRFSRISVVSMDGERSHVAFGPAAAQYITAKVLGITPRSQSAVDMALVVDSDYVYQAEAGVMPGSSAWQLPLADTAPVVRGMLARSMPDNINQMVISWAPSPGAERYLIEISSDGTSWTRVGETTASSYLGPALYGSSTLIRVAAAGITRGPWSQSAYGSAAGYMWSANSATPMWTINTNKMWSA